MDLALNIKGDSSGAGEAFTDVAAEGQAAAKSIEDAFSSMSKKTDAAFAQMEREATSAAKSAADAAKKSADEIVAAQKKIAESMKAMGDEGAAAWKKAEDAEKANAAQLQKVQAGLLAVGAAAVAFGVDSVHAFAEAEKVQKQLERVAGDLTDAFSQQADALESQLAIDGELIKQQQTLLLQWGAAPSQIEPTIRAIEDYAAATGKDALTATMELIKGVETGGAKFQALGVHYQETSDKTENLTLLTQGLADKFGGAAAVNAASLTGRMNALNIAMGNVKEGFGGVIASMESKLGVMDKVAGFMSSWASRIGGAGDIGSALLAISPIGQGSALGDMMGPGPQAPDIAGGPTSSPAAIHLKGFTDDGPDKKAAAAQKSAESHAAKMAALAEKNLESMRKEQKDIDTLDAAAMAKDQADYAEELALSAKRVDLAIKEGNDKTAALQLSIAKDGKLYEEQVKYRDKAAARMLKETNDANREAAQSQARSAAAAANAIGAAFVNALSDQLAKLAEGGELDVAVFIGDIIAAAIGVASVALSAAFPQFAGLIQAAGGLATVGVRAGAKGISADNQKRRAAGAASGGSYSYHSGGWVGDEIDIPRHHSGAWIGADEQRAILQTGERVLSRKEVHHIGGAGAVDNMAKGGGPRVVVQIHAIDSKGAAESIENDFGKGMRRALRSGRGDFPALMGGSPR